MRSGHSWREEEESHIALFSFPAWPTPVLLAVSSGSPRLPTLGLIIGTWQSPHSVSPPICYSSYPSFSSPPAPLANKYKYPECLLQTWLAEPAAIAVYLFRIAA